MTGASKQKGIERRDIIFGKETVPNLREAKPNSDERRKDEKGATLNSGRAEGSRDRVSS